MNGLAGEYVIDDEIPYRRCRVSTRFKAIALVALFATAAAAFGLARAAAGAKSGSKPPELVYKRAAGVYAKAIPLHVVVRTAGGAELQLFIANPRILLLKNKVVAKAKDFKVGDKLVVYYSEAPQGGTKYLCAALDPPSEIVLVELRNKPVAATFKSFDPKTRKLTVQQGSRNATYTVVAPLMVIREMKGAVLGRRDTKDERGYGPGDKLLLVMTADKKQVRMVVDSKSYDQVTQDVKHFPLPPVSKIPAK